ncbi:MAG: DUF4339 domain-containing protein [Sphingobacteriales bacterium]|nr:DUF4339 domain-containing protein [Sphingobacteriales bacterium]
MYFISIDNYKSGPFTYEEIVELHLTDDMLVWKDGLEDWVSIKELPELKNYLNMQPPMLPHERAELEKQIVLDNRYDEAISFFKRNILHIILVAFIISIVHFVGSFINTGTQLDNLFPVFLTDDERRAPLTYYFLNSVPGSLLFSILIFLSISFLKYTGVIK